MVERIYVEKTGDHAVEAAGVLADVQQALGITALQKVRLLVRYDVEGLSHEDFQALIPTVFSEPMVDIVYQALPKTTAAVLAVEALPGQYDQRADSCAQCIQISTCKERPPVATAKVYLLEGSLTKEDLARIQQHLINPVESRPASLELPQTLATNYPIPTTVETLTGFTALSPAQLADFVVSYGLAMDQDDLSFCQAYFKEEEKRDPTITEIRMLDTYWSDHCRHTTFSTEIVNADINVDYIAQSYARYNALRIKLGRQQKPVTLMDLAIIGAKGLRANGLLTELDESEEINACSVKIQVDVDGVDEEWLLMFKNETHNHPTEIEPFGGAATCLGGAIRDPLSGRSYVYQAMRVTGAANPLAPVSDTRAGKLPQRKIVTTAAAGYSSYGNQIGLATGQVQEIYHPGYQAKRMEIGAVIGAAPAHHVRRERPDAGDIIVLLGGKTGRDGCGGATGSSKSHTADSLGNCGAEVQKGNAPEERKLQRLMRNPAATRLIKRCNDFGAGGVSVAIGELADGLIIDLSAVPKKYDGLDGTELAISESQERMAVVVSPKDVAQFCALATEENLDATVVATVTAAPRLVMHWNGVTIVDLSRAFINSNGAKKQTTLQVNAPVGAPCYTIAQNTAAGWAEHMTDLNIASQKGLGQRFDSTIGAATVLMPYGGKHQLTPIQAMAAKLPVLDGETHTTSLMAWGYDARLASFSPYHGAMAAVVQSLTKLVATGGSRKQAWLTFQEYFPRVKNDPLRLGQPFAALLGALDAQMALEVGAIGGKDSMSGSFEELDVPPTLVSFAVGTAKDNTIISPELKAPGHKLYRLLPQYHANGLPDLASVAALLDKAQGYIASGAVQAAWALDYGGVAEGIAKMCFGNRLGLNLSAALSNQELFAPCYGGLLLATSKDLPNEELLGEVIADYKIVQNGVTIDLAALQAAWEAKLQPVFPYLAPSSNAAVPTYSYTHKAARPSAAAAFKAPQPQVLIPVFPGTNCEYDTARAAQLAGARANIFVVRNRSGAEIEQSVAEFARLIAQSQIIAIPGGFSGGDEPDGSGKFITAFFRNPQIKEEVQRLLGQRDGLICGICNGFQALIKLGLVPFGQIIQPDASCPTLSFNAIGRHQSSLVHTRIASNKSPWLMQHTVGDVHTVAISHGEGRFVASQALLQQLADNGQIATQYVDHTGAPTLDIRFNPNLSAHGVEGITSPDGRVFGKMCHSERYRKGLFKNVDGNHDQNIFGGAVAYYK